jgi:hypothetical protein
VCGLPGQGRSASNSFIRNVIFIDSEECPPSLYGTGTEKYFNAVLSLQQKVVH